ncbi:MAG: hypothetical protein R3A52_25700 [Polyangiales bacterium]
MTRAPMEPPTPSPPSCAEAVGPSDQRSESAADHATAARATVSSEKDATLSSP